MKKLGLLFLIGYSVSAGVAHAATYYVSKTGNNSTSCAQAQSTSTPKGTIGAGLGCLVAGDTLLVRAGTYDEVIKDNVVSVPSGTSWTNKVRIAAYPGETVWLAPTSGEGVLYLTGTQQYIEFDGINMRGPTFGAVIAFGGESQANHIRVQNAELANENPTGISGTIAIGHSSHDNEFINLNIHGLGGPYGIYLSGFRNLIDHCDIHHVSGGGVHIYGNNANPSNNVISNTKIHDISTYEYFGDANDPRRFGILFTGDNNVVYNNIFYNITSPQPTSSAGLVFFTGSGNTAYNNTIVNNIGYGVKIDSYSSSIVIKNNIAYRNTGGDYVDNGSGTTTSNNLYGVDPLFVDLSANNFQLQSTSRAIDAAVSISVVTSDLVGMARPQGSAPDIGAYEYGRQMQSSAPAAPTGVRIVSN